MTGAEPAGQGASDIIVPWVTSAGIAWAIAVAGFVLIFSILIIFTARDRR